MNTVKQTKQAQGDRFTFEELMVASYNATIYTAFIGSWGDHDGNDLFLITYDSVILARSPSTTWSSSDGIVVRFCDVTIEEVTG